MGMLNQRDEQSGLWTFVTHAAVAAGGAVIIQVTALDRPGNAVTKTLHHALIAGALQVVVWVVFWSFGDWEAS